MICLLHALTARASKLAVETDHHCSSLLQPPPAAEKLRSAGEPAASHPAPDYEMWNRILGVREVVLTEADAPGFVPPDLQEFGIEPAALKYRGEGNHTLVAAWEKSRQVLRFHKVELGHSHNNGPDSGPDKQVDGNCAASQAASACSCSVAGPHCCSCYRACVLSIRQLPVRRLRDTPRSLNYTFVYMETVMKRLLGVRYIPPIDVLHADTESLRRINSLMLPWRSKLHLANDIDVDSHEVIVTSDVAFLPTDMDKFVAPGCPTLCVEIKPNQGFIPASSLVWEKVRRNLCRFCLLQFHPRMRRKFSGFSNYCSCDMFSGDKQRMLSAIKCLVETPQINFRVFENGQLRYHTNNSKESLLSCLRGFFTSSPAAADSDVGWSPAPDPETLVDAFAETLYQALTQEFDAAADADDSSVSLAADLPEEQRYTQSCARQKLLHNETATPTDYQASRLSPNCVLGRILAVQLLDRLGVDGVMSHYNRLVMFLQERSTSWDCSKGSLIDFVESQSAPLPVVQSAQLYDTYLTSLVAKACSIMVAMAPSCVPSAELPVSVPHVTDPVSGRAILVSLAIVDLDPKPFKNVRRSYNEELEALKCFNAATAAAANGLGYFPAKPL